jgi:hypothetical protein
MDFGFQGGIGIYDFGSSDVTAVRMGADFKVLAMPRDSTLLVDITAGAGIGVETGDNLNVLRVGPSVIASRGFFGGDPADPVIRPYAGLDLIFSREQVRGEKTSGLTVPIHLGSEIRIAHGIRVDAELQWRIGHRFGDTVAFSTGATTTF